MQLSKKIVVSSFILIFMVAPLGYSASVKGDDSRSNQQKSGVASDRYGREVYCPDQGKISYPASAQENHALDWLSPHPVEDISLPCGAPSPSAPFQIDSLLLQETWRYGIFGSGIGKNGIVAADIDNDGTIEIICGGSTTTFLRDDFWYILEYSGVPGEYSMKWISNIVPHGISSIAAFDADGDDTLSIYIGLPNGHIRIYHGASLQEIGHIGAPGNHVYRIQLADADNDLSDEIVFCDETHLFAYNPASLTLEHQIAYGDSDFEVGNVDSDAQVEIVLAGGLVIEFDGVTPTVEWDYSEFGYLVELSDIDSDGMDEIIGASAWYYITAFDADVKSPKWQINADLDVAALLVTDVDDDDIDDILYGDGQWGQIHCYDAVTQVEKWDIPNPEHGVTDIAVCDTDRDGDLEIMWGAGATSTGSDYLYIHDIPTLILEWQSEHFDGPFHAVDVGDVDSDGEQEIIVASFESESGYGDGTVLVFDAATHDLEWQSDPDMFEGHAWTGIHDLRVADVDDDTVQEIVVATDKLYDGAIYVIDGQSHLMQQHLYDEGAPIYSLAVADVDNDGETEIVAGAGREHTGAPGVYVYVIDGSTGTVEWHSISLGDYWSEIYAVEVADIDGDTVPEIVAVNDNIFVFDGISHQQWQSSLSGCHGLDLCDTDGDGIEEIVTSTNLGYIVAIDGATYSEELIFSIGADPIKGLRACDIEQDGSIELIIGCAGQLSAFNLEDSAIVWRSDTLSYSVGEYNALAVSDIDSDMRTEVVVGTDYSVVEFEGPAYVSIDGPVVTDFSRATLLQNRPNPFGLHTEVRYRVAKSGAASLKVYDAQGSLVRILADKQQTPGWHIARWDGLDESGKGVAAGVYFCQLSVDTDSGTGGSLSTKKMVLLR